MSEVRGQRSEIKDRKSKIKDYVDNNKHDILSE